MTKYNAKKTVIDGITFGSKPFKVTVQRYSEGHGWDAFFISDVYAIRNNEFLVYDDGDFSASCGEEWWRPYGFKWVNFTETIPDCADECRRILRVELYDEEYHGKKM